MPKRNKDRKIEKENRLTILYNAPAKMFIYNGKKRWKRRVVVKCKCGIIKEINYEDMRRGDIKSCGCLRRETTKNLFLRHGLTNHPLYVVWKDIKERCYRKKAKNYPLYGGKGVRMCDQWKNDFKAFHKWCIENGWEAGLHVDKDKKGNPLLYSPETCSILTTAENQKFKNNSVYLTMDGVSHHIIDWGKLTGLGRDAIKLRLRRGWSVKDSLTIPLKRGKNKL